MKIVSPIRLMTNLTDALNIGLNFDATIGNFGQVCLSPKEIYYQISNGETDIVFNGNYKVYVADLCGNNILEITENVFIEEQTDSNGIKQIGYEILPINKSFEFDDVILKFQNTLNGNIWYSNPIQIREEVKSTRFDYFAYFDCFGYSYSKFTAKKQSIRLISYFKTYATESNSEEYVNEIGNKVSNFATLTNLENYIFEKIDNYTFRFVNQILAHPIKYINGNRCTNSPLLKDIELFGTSNIGNSEFKASINYNDTYTAGFQIAEALKLVTKTPIGRYTFTTLPSEIVLTFNQNVQVQSGTIKLYKSTTLLEVYTPTEVTIVDNVATIPFGFLPAGFDTYYLEIIDGMFYNDIYGTLPLTKWEFVLSLADYKSIDYKDKDYFTQ